MLGRRTSVSEHKTSNLDLTRSLEHLAAAMRAALLGSGSADMRVTSEDARDIQRAAEIIRLYRMARPAHETPAAPRLLSAERIAAELRARAEMHKLGSSFVSGTLKGVSVYNTLTWCADEILRIFGDRPAVETSCNCGVTDGLHEFACPRRSDGDDWKGAEKASTRLVGVDMMQPREEQWCGNCGERGHAHCGVDSK